MAFSVLEYTVLHIGLDQINLDNFPPISLNETLILELVSDKKDFEILVRLIVLFSLPPL